MPLTIYEKELIRILRTRCGELTTGQTVEKLTALGVIDSTLCKVLAVREYVRDIMETGIRKTDAMWLATERLACSCEYVRKCMYYYTDMNIG